MYLYYPAVFYLGYLIFQHASFAASQNQAAIEHLDLSSQTELAWKSLLESLSLNFYEGASEITEELLRLQQQAELNLQQVNMYSLLFALLSLLYVTYLFFYVRRKQDNTKAFSIHLTIIAFICLIIGVSLPMLNLIAYKELPVLGTVVFKYESKSIVSTIETLWLKQQYFIASLILLFSLLTPLIKLFCSFLIRFLKNQARQIKLRNFVHLIGKWSMTDVFIVAVLLAFFSISVDESTDAWLGHGLYFFAAYSIISLWVASDMAIHQDMGRENSE